MSEIMRSLSQMRQVVENLEGSVEHLESSMTGEQRDMFSAPSPTPIIVNNEPTIDKALVTKKLDLAIEKIEDILEEGDAAHG